MDSVFFSAKSASGAQIPVRARWDELLVTWDFQKLAQVFSLALGLFIAHTLANAIYRLWFHPLAKFPGPRLNAVLYWPYLYSNHVQGSWVRKVSELHRKYGPVVRIGPNHLSLDGAVAWPEVFALRGAEECPKPVNHFFEGDSASLIGAPRDVHRRQRRQLNHAFSDASLTKQEVTIKRYVDMTMQRLSSRADAGTTINFVDWMNFTTFDIIGDLAFSESFDCLEKNGYHPWVLSLFEGIRGGAMRRFLLSYPLLKLVVTTLGLSKDMKTQTRNRYLAREKAKNRMEKGLETTEGHADFMTYMMKANRDGQHGFEDHEMLATAPIIVVAGSETTATALSGLMFQLTQQPEIYKKVTDEIRATFSSEDDITLRSSATLEYLHACTEEILRFYPPAAETSPRISTGRLIAGNYVPAGTRMSVYQFQTFRNPDHWAEPDSFIPERWLSETHPLYDPKFKSDNHAIFKPFSFGARDCIGKNLAYSELRLIAARFMYRFDFELASKQDDWQNSQRIFGVWEKGPLNLLLKARNSA
ncbi:Cytochrome P450 monooxygenase astJ [Cladobotryum mycophilum]|uniref:Cytochrome P450 monooxygenase astJ n=1 Tax=Cladobotryum mycophilum TaxID=491253 RepID=A0ABR0SCE9_9HYPO